MWVIFRQKYVNFTHFFIIHTFEYSYLVASKEGEPSKLNHAKTKWSSSTCSVNATLLKLLKRSVLSGLVVSEILEYYIITVISLSLSLSPQRHKRLQRTGQTLDYMMT